MERIFQSNRESKDMKCQGNKIPGWGIGCLGKGLTAKEKKNKFIDFIGVIFENILKVVCNSLQFQMNYDEPTTQNKMPSM